MSRKLSTAEQVFHLTMSHNTTALSALLATKVSPDQRKVHGATPLIVAAYIGDLDMTLLLLRYRANVNATTSSGRNAVFTAASKGRSLLLKELLQHGGLPERTHDGSTALGQAIQNGDSPHYPEGYSDVVKLLLEAKSNPNEKDNDQSPLLLAAYNGSLSICRLLLAAGASVSQASYNGTPPEEIALAKTEEAKEKGHQKLLESCLAIIPLLKEARKNQPLTRLANKPDSHKNKRPKLSRSKTISRSPSINSVINSPNALSPKSRLPTTEENSSTEHGLFSRELTL